MATGDLEGNLERMRVQLRSIAYPHPLDIQGLRDGLPGAILPLLHYALLGYSRHVARYLSACGYELYAKSDLRFVECTFKFLRTEFNYRCSLTLAQLFAKGFAERKLHFVHDVIQICKRKHYELLKQFRQAKFMCKLQSARQSNKCEMENQVPPAQPCLDEEMSELDQYSEEHVPYSKHQDIHEPRAHQQGEDHSGCRFRAASPTKVTIERGHGKREPRAKRSLEAFCALRNSYQEMYQKLVDISDQMAERFCVLEQGLSTTTANIQDRLVGLEDRLYHLEHNPPCQVVTAPPNVVVNYNKACDEEPSPRSCVEQATVAGIRDISNTHRRNPGANYCHNLDQETSGLTQDFIAKVKARFHNAKKLLDEH